jgi:uncharacterized protein YcbX
LDGFKIGDVELALVKPCSRCVIPSINPQTGAKDSSLNRVLAQHRRAKDGKMYLGQNAIIQKASLDRGVLISVIRYKLSVIKKAALLFAIVLRYNRLFPHGATMCQ